MLSAWITDQHFGCRSDSEIFLDNYEKFYEEVFFPKLDSLGIKTVVDLGDTWEHRRQINVNTMKRAREMFFDELASRQIQLYMIYGNHDVMYKSSNHVNSVDHLETSYPNITVLKEPTEIDLDVKVGLVPWIHKNNFEETLKWLEATEAKIIGGHFEIEGFEMTRGHLASHGLDPDIFSKFDRVYSGHFHVRSSKKNITYLSNPSQTNWGDVGLKKGFHIFDSSDSTMTPVDNPYVMFGEFTWGGKRPDPKIFSGIYGRAIIPSFEEINRAELDLYLNEVQEISAGFQVVETTMDLEGNLVEYEEDGKPISTSALLDAYIEEAVKNVENLDSKILKRMVNDLYVETSSRMEIE